MTELNVLAENVTAAQDDILRELNLAPRVRERLLHATRRRVRPVRLFAAATAAAAALALVWHFRAASLTYTTGNLRGTSAVGAWLAAPPDGELLLHFSDQSTVTLAAASHARVVELRSREAKILLESGRVSVTVIHHKDRNWHLRAGPFDIAVTGTRFDVAWIPDREQFEVHTLEGKVEVTGEQFVSRAVPAGETLRAGRIDGQWRFTETDVPSNQSSALTPSAGLASRNSSPPLVEPSVAPPASIARRSTQPSASQTWRDLAAAGQYRAALEQAENDGFEGLCQKSNLSDLLALSEAARFAGRADRARLALTALRDRFRGEAAASVATFTLGRMAFDSSRDYLGAAKWFRIYLSEQPRGSLAREAAGRLVESLERGGDHAGAKISARDYLSRYPDGPQNRLARQILGE